MQSKCLFTITILGNYTTLRLPQEDHNSGSVGRAVASNTRGPRFKSSQIKHLVF